MAETTSTKKKIVITGGTGFIGKRLLRKIFEDEKLSKEYGPIVLITRSASKESFKNSANITDRLKRAVDEEDIVLAVWDTRSLDAGWTSHFDGAYAIIHLAGEGIFERRWTDEFKRELMESRVRTTRLIVDAIAGANPKPQVFVSSSAIGFYGDIPDDRRVDESFPSPAEGTDFLADICIAWEREAQRAKEVSGGQTRVAMARIGIVLQKEGGALKNMIMPFWLRIGGHIGSGEQWFAWIHMQDAVNALLFPLQSNIEGPYNVTAPEPKKLKDFCIDLGASMNRASWAHVPWIAARVLMGEVANTLVTGQRVVPKKLLDHGFEFQFPDTPGALVNIVQHSD